ncbi:MAG: hypothetical protein ACR2L6_11025 [Gemmatimonadaceae bacterium]
MWLPRRLAFGLLLAALPGCDSPAGPGDLESSLVETHRAIVDGVVLGELNQPLHDVDIVLRIAGSQLPSPRTRTDAAGRFLLVLAIYNGAGGADSTAATVYAFAQPPAYSTHAAAHADAMLRFLPVTVEPPRTSVTLRMPVF